jgi:hypothetical protein
MKTVTGLVALALPFSLMASCSSGSTNSNLGVWTPGGSPVSSAGSSSGGGPSSASGSPGSGSTESGLSGSSGGSSSGTFGGASSSGSSSSGSSSGPPTGSSGSSGSSSSSSGSKADAGAGSIPCDVSTVLTAKCTSCHSDPPVAGSLTGLVTYADLMATAKEDPTKNEAQLSLSRMQNSTSPMPPSSVNMPPTASDISTLQNWINSGYPSGPACAPDAGAAPATAVFAGTAAFKASGSNCSGQHNAGQNCLQCHGFAFAGTIYDGSGKALAGAEVRVVDSTGKATSAYSCTNGNFYVQNGSIMTPAHTAARNAASTTSMVSAMTTGGCNQCHCTGGGCTTARIHLP